MNISIYKFSIYIVLIFLISLNNLISGDLRNITIEDFNGKKTTYSAEEVSDFQFQNKGDNFILNLNMKNKADEKLFDVMSIDSIYFNSEYDTTLIRYMNKTFALSTDSIDYISFTN